MHWFWRGLNVAKRWCKVGSFKLTWWPDFRRHEAATYTLSTSLDAVRQGFSNIYEKPPGDGYKIWRISTSSRSNDVINAKFSHFLVKRAALCFSRSRVQTKTDSFDLQKKEDAQCIGLSEVSRQIWTQVNCLGARGQSSPGSSTIFRTFRFSSITSEVLVLEQ